MKFSLALAVAAASFIAVNADGPMTTGECCPKAHETVAALYCK